MKYYKLSKNEYESLRNRLLLLLIGALIIGIGRNFTPLFMLGGIVLVISAIRLELLIEKIGKELIK